MPVTTPPTGADANNLYTDARLYERICTALGSEDAEPLFYAGLLAPGRAGSAGPQVLELGCGSGRLALQLAACGLQVSGIDNAASMLELARKKTASRPGAVQLHLQDLRHFCLGQHFAAVLLPSNNLAHLHTLADLQACVQRVRDHLEEGGLFVIDYFNPSVLKLALGPTRAYDVLAASNASDPALHVSETSVYDAATQTSAVCWYVRIGDAPVVHLNFKLRIWYPQELDALLQCFGLEIVAKYGNYGREAFDSQSQRQLLVCKVASR